jgi:hypothetical protein
LILSGTETLTAPTVLAGIEGVAATCRLDDDVD